MKLRFIFSLACGLLIAQQSLAFGNRYSCDDQTSIRRSYYNDPTHAKMVLFTTHGVDFELQITAQTTKKMFGDVLGPIRGTNNARVEIERLDNGDISVTVMRAGQDDLVYNVCSYNSELFPEYK